MSDACVGVECEESMGKSKSPYWCLIYDVMYHEQELGGQMYAMIFPRAD